MYRQAAEAAAAHNVTLEQFVREAVQIHLPDDDDAAIQAMFTPERLAHIDEALAEVKSGKFYTMEQAKEYFADKEDAYRQKTPGENRVLTLTTELV